MSNQTQQPCAFCQLFFTTYPKTIKEPRNPIESRDFKTLWLHLFQAHHNTPQPLVS